MAECNDAEMNQATTDRYIMSLIGTLVFEQNTLQYVVLAH